MDKQLCLNLAVGVPLPMKACMQSFVRLIHPPECFLRLTENTEVLRQEKKKVYYFKMKVNFSLGKIRNYTSVVEFQSINLQWHSQWCYSVYYVNITLAVCSTSNICMYDISDCKSFNALRACMCKSEFWDLRTRQHQKNCTNISEETDDSMSHVGLLFWVCLHSVNCWDILEYVAGLYGLDRNWFSYNFFKSKWLFCSFF